MSSVKLARMLVVSSDIVRCCACVGTLPALVELNHADQSFLSAIVSEQIIHNVGSIAYYAKKFNL